MSYDRVVYWASETPTYKQIGEVLEDFLGDLAESVEWNDDRWYAVLHGHPQHMFRRQTSVTHSRFGPESRERWFEVWVNTNEKPCIDVITRLADEATTALADAFAERCAKFWNGRYNP